MAQQLILIRGVPGSGKTTLAKLLLDKLADPDDPYKWYEADQWFEENGPFHPSKLGQAHMWCQTNTLRSLRTGYSVIVSNTFIKLWEMDIYMEMAETLNITLQILPCSYLYQNTHGVPLEKVLRMKNEFEPSATTIIWRKQ